MEACWYFTGSREQYRLTGTALVVDKDTEDGELQKASPVPNRRCNSSPHCMPSA